MCQKSTSDPVALAVRSYTSVRTSLRVHTPNTCMHLTQLT